MLLMMGGETPETCWATHKLQVTNLWNCCILLVELFETYDDGRTYEGQTRSHIPEELNLQCLKSRDIRTDSTASKIITANLSVPALLRFHISVVFSLALKVKYYNHNILGMQTIKNAYNLLSVCSLKSLHKSQKKGKNKFKIYPAPAIKAYRE